METTAWRERERESWHLLRARKEDGGGRWEEKQEEEEEEKDERASRRAREAEGGRETYVETRAADAS